MINWLIKLLGGVPKSKYETLENENASLKNENASLKNENDSLKTTMAEYAKVTFPDSGEYNFSVNSQCPYAILVKKGTSLLITGYKGEEKLEKIYCQEG
jgi:hypothetical protein